MSGGLWRTTSCMLDGEENSATLPFNIDIVHYTLYMYFTLHSTTCYTYVYVVSLSDYVCAFIIDN